MPNPRPSNRAERMGTLALVGGATNVESLSTGRLLTLFGAGAEIGRRPPPGRMRTVVTLGDRSVSGYHAQITHQGQGFVIEDKGSMNGTILDGRPVIAPTLLREGAVLFLGAQVLVFRTMTSAEITAVEADIADPFAPVATLCPLVATICAKLRLLAPSPTELFLLGETGVGKEVFTNSVHVASGRAGRLVAINCAALPRELVESELFGYERGAHSTAKDRKAGLIEAAEGGTLFLDELAEMPLDVQSKLLRFLQDRKYMSVGSTRLETANVRIIAATSRLSGKTGSPRIQDALMGRLGAQPIHLPALRDRPEDLGRLSAYFLGLTGCERPFESEAFQALFLYDWPHNIRELQKVIAEAELLSRDAAAIGLDHLPPAIRDALDRPSPKGSGPIPPQPHAAALRPTDAAAPRPTDAAALRPADAAPLRPTDTAALRPTDTAPLRPADPAPLRPTDTAALRPTDTVALRPTDAAALRRPAPSADELRALMRQFNGNIVHVSNHVGRQWAVIARALRRHGIDPAHYRFGAGDGFRRPGAPPDVDSDEDDDGFLEGETVT